MAKKTKNAKERISFRHRVKKSPKYPNGYAEFCRHGHPKEPNKPCKTCSHYLPYISMRLKAALEDELINTFEHLCEWCFEYGRNYEMVRTRIGWYHNKCSKEKNYINSRLPVNVDKDPDDTNPWTIEDQDRRDLWTKNRRIEWGVSAEDILKLDIKLGLENDTWTGWKPKWRIEIEEKYGMREKPVVKYKSQGIGLKTHCNRGHEYNEENTSWLSNGSKRCRKCMNLLNPYVKVVKTHCNHGHLWNENNTLKDKRGWKRCRICVNESSRKSRKTRGEMK